MARRGPPRPDFILADELMKAIAGALDINPHQTHRIILDMTAGQPVRVYVEQYGTGCPIREPGDVWFHVAPTAKEAIDAVAREASSALHRV